MNTTKKLRWAIGISAVGTLAVTVLRVLAVLFELDGETGYFGLTSPLNTAANILLFVLSLALLTLPFFFKEREIAPVLNYQSAFFIFFSVMSACLLLVNAYVRWMEHDDASLRGSAAQGGAGFLLPNVICSVIAALGFFVYAFGRNEKRSNPRSLIGLLGAAVLFLRAIELHFNNYIEMNHPIKIYLQLALVSTALALLYMAKCEFRVCDASPRARLFSMLVSPLFSISYGIPMLVSYYTKVYANFSFLIDAILLLALNGAVLASYMPCRKARPIAEAEWEELDASLEAPSGAANFPHPSASLTPSPQGEGISDSPSTVGDDVLGVPAPCDEENTVGTGVPDSPQETEDNE